MSTEEEEEEEGREGFGKSVFRWEQSRRHKEGHRGRELISERKGNF